MDEFLRCGAGAGVGGFGAGAGAGVGVGVGAGAGAAGDGDGGFGPGSGAGDGGSGIGGGPGNGSGAESGDGSQFSRGNSHKGTAEEMLKSREMRIAIMSLEVLINKSIWRINLERDSTETPQPNLSF